MTLPVDIRAYNDAQSSEYLAICDSVADLIAKVLPQAEGKVWHGHPVWFIDQNPVVGYSIKKAGVQALFWSGQSFSKAGLSALGKFKAASFDVKNTDDLAAVGFEDWLLEAAAIQWNYKDLPKKKALEPLFVI